MHNPWAGNLRHKSIGAAFLLAMVFWVILPSSVSGFGFTAHRIINRKAVFTLPPEMIGFYKKHIEYLSERAIDPDRRAHAIPGEAPRHYIDVEYFGQIPFDSIPRRWDQAIAMFSEDSLNKFGVLPWHINLMMSRLTQAFIDQDLNRILSLSAHIGHYISDACTPLHTTKYYNGRIPTERGIHALWETRIPELFGSEFDYFVGQASFLPNPRERAWELVGKSHNQVAIVYQVWDSLLTVFAPDRMFVHEMRGQALMRYFSRDFSRAFHSGMNNMVETHMQLAIKSVGDFWYTAWVNAGQPDLYKLERRALSRQHRRQLEKEEQLWRQVEQPAGRTY